MRGEGVGGGERHSSRQGGGRQPKARSRGQPTPSTAAQRQALQARHMRQGWIESKVCQHPTGSRRSGLGTAVLRQTVGQPRHEGQSRTFPEDTAWDIQGDEGKRVEQQYPSSEGLCWHAWITPKEESERQGEEDFRSAAECMVHSTPANKLESPPTGGKHRPSCTWASTLAGLHLQKHSGLACSSPEPVVWLPWPPPDSPDSREGREL